MDYLSAEKNILQVLREQLPGHYCFHNWEHTREVIDAAALLAAQESCSETEMLLLKTAALCHDTGYLYRYEKNEELGVDFARRTLPAWGYGEKELETICRLIMATTFPYHPQDRLEKIICDADLYYLLTDRFAPRTILLREEFASVGRKFSNEDWEKLETNFLSVLVFFTPYCQEKYVKIKPVLLESVMRIFRSSMS